MRSIFPRVNYKADRQACSTHHQIVLWICFWFSICQTQQRYQQILRRRRQCCLAEKFKFKSAPMSLSNEQDQTMTRVLYLWRHFGGSAKNRQQAQSAKKLRSPHWSRLTDQCIQVAKRLLTERSYM